MSSAPSAPESLRLSEQGEDVWQQLRRYVEWAQDFALIFLFSSDPAVVSVFHERLRSAQRLRVSDLEIQQPEHPETLVKEVLDRVRRPSEKYQSLRAPWWVEVYRHERDDSWNEARRTLLARLNERRELLRRTLRRPLILVLPFDFPRITQETAPDLWSIRDFAVVLPFAEIVEQPAREVVPRDSGTTGYVSSRDTSADPLVREWQRLLSRAGQIPAEQLSSVIGVGLQAFDAAFALGDLKLAGEIADETLALARTAADQNSEGLRDLSISLDRAGDVAQQRGDLSTAEQHYQESLELRRTLAEQLQTPRALRELSVSLSKVGDVAQRRGDLTTAEQHYLASLKLFRSVAEQLQTPEARRDLSVSLNKVGDVARQRGDLSSAEQHYQESLEIARTLAEQLQTPEALWDLGVALNKVGDVAQQRGVVEGAEVAYRESEELIRSLADQLETPKALRDLSEALSKVGDVARQRGNLNHAEAAYREALELASRLVHAFPEIGEYAELQEHPRAALESIAVDAAASNADGE
ncbi:MAG: tetratricopeptide repeat protein [Longimicrobiaceae bacterium]